ncbi:AcrR family transcriptional regulator [Sphingobium sp. OAS761]|uniref:TetR/AcrR family transcriptional regulator n=1 Tax=Sphingobium sp. OAS761 TaxID=2817901 RepID=UPI00209D8D97|nr:TetR/AcrR family transcriptional regulator [Sphingobium sp. OAS761]MCP1470307.1 AcrR family transcriptional regulator [Sphingobium sp. OAS761]
MHGTSETIQLEERTTAADSSIRRRVGRPSAREAERKHEAMLEAALEEFSSHGFHGASVRAIAERAGLSTRTLYNRYTDKAALFAACLEMSALQDVWEPQERCAALQEQLIDFSIHMQGRLNQDRQVRLARVIFRECTSFPQLEAISRYQFDRFQLAPVRQILEAHGFDAAQAKELGTTYVAMVFQKWQNRVIYGERPMTKAAIRRQAEVATALFLRGAGEMRGDENGRN